VTHLINEIALASMFNARPLRSHFIDAAASLLALITVTIISSPLWAQTYTHVSVGYAHVCAMRSDNTVHCWGDNSSGPAGGVSDSYATPNRVLGLTPSTQVSAGKLHTCAITREVGIFCWGSNFQGQLGNDPTQLRSSPTPVGAGGATLALAGNAAQIAVGARFSCARMTSGAVYCWGDNPNGQLGDGTTNSGGTPRAVLNIGSAIAISTGDSHACAIILDGTARCWGSNISGQLGNGNSGNSPITTPVIVSGLSGATAISAGRSHTCAVAGGLVRCWGNGSNGQISQSSNSSLPVTVPGITNAVDVAAGESHTCARLTTGQLKCWGNSENGELGDSFALGGASAVVAPFTVPGLSGVSAVSAGYGITCAIASNGLHCFGKNEQGQLGNNARLDSTIPVRAYGISDAAQIAAAANAYCARHASGRVSCWGANDYGEIGLGSSIPAYATPQTLPWLTNARAIAGGDRHFCAALANGSVQCWGSNQGKQLGSDDTLAKGPIAVSGISNAISVAAGRTHSCALLGTGGVRCWGGGSDGQLGNGGSGFSTATPVDVINLGGAATAISSGADHTCALVGSGMKCWGRNHLYQLGGGSGNTAPSAQPVSPRTGGADLANVIKIAAGKDTSCVIRTNNRVSCWGENIGYKAFFALATSPVFEPIESATLGERAAVAQGNSVGCAIDLSGYVTCVGNGSGPPIPQIADRVAGMDSAVELALGSGSRCARKSDGTVWCWGGNSRGQLGDARGLQENGTPQLVTSGVCTFDIDEDGRVTAQTDGLLLTRALLGFSGSQVTQSAVGAGAKRNDWKAIRAHLLQNCDAPGLAN
jgi:alpha-tubulin suppressor-like RCC1 family protein